jgi:hypothetical protein
MIAVIFEVIPKSGRRDQYLDIAASLRPLLDEIDGFISIERFESLTQPGKILSLSFWRDEQAVDSVAPARTPPRGPDPGPRMWCSTTTACAWPR